MNDNEVYQGQIPDSPYFFVNLFEKPNENKNSSVITAICSYAFRNLTFSNIVPGLEDIFTVTSY